MSAPDVLVVGLGGMGSAAAAHLAGRGLAVRGLERFSPAHDRGSSHGGSRVVRQSYFEDPAYVPLLRRAYELWDELAESVGHPLLTRTGGVYLGPPGSQTVAGSLAAAREHGLPHEVLDAAAVRERWPVLDPDDADVAVFEEAAGYARPEATVSAHLEVARRAGADLRFGETVTGWRADGEGVAVSTAAGEVHRADRLVLSPGAWAPEVLADLGLPLAVERQVQHWFAPTGGTEGFRPGELPVYVSEDRGLAQVYGFPALDGPGGGVKCAFFRRGTQTAPDALDRSVAAPEVAEMAERMSSLLPRLPARPLRGVPCLYTCTPDHHFVLAPHPAHPAVVLAAGFSGHGFKFVPVVGEVVADLVESGTTPHPIDLFDPARLLTPVLLDEPAPVLEAV